VLGVGAVVPFGASILFGAGTWWPLLVPAYVIVARVLGPRVWPEERPWPLAAVLTFGAFFAGVAVLVGFFIAYGIEISAHLCGKDGYGPSSAGPIAGLVTYAVLTPLSARVPARHMLWLWPVFVLAGVVVEVIVTAAIPSNHGSFCET
jgi:hypothetical protein